MTEISIARSAVYFDRFLQCTGYTPLLTACEYGRLDTVKVLKAEGANLHASTRLSHNAMELCDWYGHLCSFREVDARTHEQQHMPLMGQHMGFTPGGPDMSAAQYMHMAASSAAAQQGAPPLPSTTGALQQPQAVPFSRAGEHFATKSAMSAGVVQPASAPPSQTVATQPDHLSSAGAS